MADLWSLLYTLLHSAVVRITYNVLRITYNVSMEPPYTLIHCEVQYQAYSYFNLCKVCNITYLLHLINQKQHSLQS